MEHYPRAALAKGVTGWVMLRCTMGPASQVQDCHVLAETPSAWGFANAALGMSDQIRAVSVKANATVPQGATFYIPINFCLDRSGGCLAEKTRAYEALAAEAGAIEGLIRGGQCAEAAHRATRLQQPKLSDFVATHCKAAAPPLPRS